MDRPPLARTWFVTKVLFTIVAAMWLLVGGLTALGWVLGRDDAGSVRCAPDSYPASNASGDHRCFRNGEAPAPGYRPDPMTDYPRD
jgi:hypothetical protein